LVAFGVGHGMGGVPGVEKSRAATAWILSTLGTCDEPYLVFAEATSGWPMTTWTTFFAPTSSMIAASSGRRVVGTFVLIVLATASSRSGSRLGSGQVMDALGQPEALGRQAVAVIVLRAQRAFDVDVDPADRVDHRDEADEVDPCVVVDRDAEQGPDRVLERPHPALREGRRVALGE
jgi:hypothetical protein